MVEVGSHLLPGLFRAGSIPLVAEIRVHGEHVAVSRSGKEIGLTFLIGIAHERQGIGEVSRDADLPPQGIVHALLQQRRTVLDVGHAAGSRLPRMHIGQTAGAIIFGELQEQ